MATLVTGGAGYIGATIVSALLDGGEKVVIVDDLSRGVRQYVNGRIFYRGNVGDRDLLRKLFSDHPDIDSVIHCAAKIVVPESVADPLGYYRNNIAYGQVLVEEAVRAGCKHFIFSSSGSIYSPEDGMAFSEESPVRPHSPYSQTKADFEHYLRYTSEATDLSAVALRYFNPIGCDPRFRTGLQIERPSHVLGKIMEAIESDGCFTVTGTDWDTRDGSGVRDYIHVWDLARAHLAALHALRSSKIDGYEVFNVGTGRGVTVNELLDAVQRALKVVVRKVDGPRRPGDVVGGYAVTSKAEECMGWSSVCSLERGIEDAARWAAVLPRVLSDDGYLPDGVPEGR